eukprot:1165831-Pyramimonas_sp.AAC.1
MCAQMPFQSWRALNLRRCVLAHSPEEVATWPLHCAQCGPPLKSSNSRRVHTSSCTQRATRANLPPRCCISLFTEAQTAARVSHVRQLLTAQGKAGHSAADPPPGAGGAGGGSRRRRAAAAAQRGERAVPAGDPAR